MNDEGRRHSAPATSNTTGHDGSAVSGRCGTCWGWVTRRCPLCAGQPEDGVTLEQAVGWARSVDRAVERHAA